MELSLLPCPFCGKPAEASHTMRATIEETMEAEPYINCSQPMCAGRHVCASVSEWQYRTDRISELEADIVTRRLDYTEDCKRLDARIEELELRIADESRACALFQSHIRELEAALTDAQERERQLNDELYYACELAIAYAHSEKDKEWAAERIEELMPPEREE